MEKIISITHKIKSNKWIESLLKQQTKIINDNINKKIKVAMNIINKLDEMYNSYNKFYGQHEKLMNEINIKNEKEGIYCTKIVDEVKKDMILIKRQIVDEVNRKNQHLFQSKLSILIGAILKYLGLIFHFCFQEIILSAYTLIYISVTDNIYILDK